MDFFHAAVLSMQLRIHNQFHGTSLRRDPGRSLLKAACAQNALVERFLRVVAARGINGILDRIIAVYFFRSFALHGAFWHSNFGVQMSHGCVNLSPLDAKYLFFFAEPALPPGFHGVHASEASPGSRVIVHL